MGVEVLRKASRWFYKRFNVGVSRLNEREFGFGVEGKIDQRHLAFSSQKVLQQFLIEKAPLFLSYSTAFYRFPDRRPMEAKEWLGAELVFDLDVDVGNFFDKNAFEQAKEQVLRLIEDFLMGDFGFKREEISVNFSGHKGFHVHVLSEAVFPLSQKARRMLVDYIQGVGLRLDLFLERAVVDGKEIWVGPVPSEGGFRGRFARMFARLCDDAKLRQVIERGIWEPVMKRRSMRKKMVLALEKSKLIGVRIDAPVTYDIYRLIRVPGSFYGQTGWIAKPVPLSRLSDFCPLHDAVVLPMDRFMRVRALAEIPAFEFGGTSFEPFQRGEEKRVPIAFGVFLIGKGLAELAGGKS